MWEDISRPWQLAFIEAWNAYCNGSIPIGSVLTNSSGEVVYRGRNRIYDDSAPINQICSNRLAHAEMNVLLQVCNEESKLLPNYTLYTTTEPCVLCFGAIVMSGIRRVRFASTDSLAGGANLNTSNNSFILSRNIDVQCEDNTLGSIQKVLRTDYLLRQQDKDRAEKLLTYEINDYPQAVELGRRWHMSDKLLKAKQSGAGINTIVNEICNEIN
ncbi:nucleoside deaminase [Cohnella sp. AR92]|uniref:nucleoside deaminase n=1 Tax=Cohnella sp. AR92 TaxID=648716 RepID=UPI000F8D7C07|nr:nucleoside deaminase [Cohnella sp. AR92]RUS45851.1 nucleoside deaminase [Cohnella sp. AR92]